MENGETKQSYPLEKKKGMFQFHIIVSMLKTVFANQLKNVLEEEKAGKTLSPKGKAVQRDVSLEFSSLTVSDPAVCPH